MVGGRIKKNNSMKIVLFLGILILGSIILSGTASASALNTSKININTQVNNNEIGLSSDNNTKTLYEPISTIPLNSSYPSSFDLRNNGKLTPIENQGNDGDCWTFGTMGSLESNLLPDENDDFSENNMKNILNYESPDGFDLDQGGTYDMALAYLSGWKGPVNESQDPYNDSSTYSPSENLNPDKHVQDVLILPSRTNSLDNSYIKWALMNYGAVATYMYMDDSSPYYNSATYSYYYNGKESIDHALDIVGWDDNYDKNNFDITPPGNGAFIIRNSWGTNWGDNGYFYVSYYDTQLGIGTANGGSNSSNFVFINAENTSNYNKNYQYDPYGWVSSIGYNSITGWFSNVFNSTGNDKLSAASFYVSSPNTTYNLYMYLNPTKNNPKSGTLVADLTGTLMSGYWTINLSSPVNIVTGELFSVVVKLTTPGNDYPIPIEYSETGYSSRATSHPGESYISNNGINWEDAYNFKDTVCLKAFTIPHIIQSTKLILNSLSGIKGEIINLNAKLTNLNNNQPLNGETINFLLNGYDIGSAITNSNGIAVLYYTLTGNPGNYQIFAIFNGDSDYNSSNITNNLVIIDNTPPTITVNILGGSYNKVQTIKLNPYDPDSTAITYYTLDGSNPQSSNTRSVYNGTAINITDTITLKYSAVDPTGNWSPNYYQTYILDKTPPVVSKVNLINNTLINRGNRNITITFSEPIKEGSTYNSISIIGHSGTVEITKYINGKVLILNPTVNYSDGNYILNLPVNSLSDLAGNGLATVFSSRFTVDTTKPIVKANLASGFYNTIKNVILSMNENGTVYYTLNGSIPTITSTKYKGPITISSTTTVKFLAVDLAGNKSPINNQTYTIDKIPPKIVTTTPSDHKTGVSIKSNIILKFTENIKISTYFNNITIKNLTTHKYVLFTKNIIGNTLNIKTSKNRLAYNRYQVTIPKGAIKDMAGNNLITNYVFVFKTG